MLRVNLIPAARLEARRRRALTRRWLVVFALLAIALGATWAGVSAATGSSRVAVAEQIQDVEAQLAETTQRISEVQANQRRVRMHLDANRQVANLPDWSLLMAMLAAQMGDDVVLNDCNLAPVVAATTPAAPSVAVVPGGAAPVTAKPTGFVLTITGLARTQPAATQYVLRLERLGLFAKVQLIDTRREPFLKDQAVAFRIVCTIELVGEVSS